MITKPKMYDNVEVNLEYERIELGGHKGVIIKAEEYTSDISGKTSLKIYTDTAKDDKQPSYFKTQYENDTRENKKYPNGAIKYVSLGEEENQVKMLKGFITAVENSNPGFTFDWKKEVDQLKGKKVGLVFGNEEYTKQDGSVGLATKLVQIRSIDKVENVKIPKVKLLDGTFVDYENYTEKKEDNDPFKDFGDVVEIDDNFLD